LAELHDAAGGRQDLEQRALVERPKLHGRLVGLDLGEELVDLDAVAGLLVPRASWTLLHRRGELGHVEDLRHDFPFPRVTARARMASRCALVWDHVCSSFAL
jgi:hypothetical protein